MKVIKEESTEKKVWLHKNVQKDKRGETENVEEKG